MADPKEVLSCRGTPNSLWPTSGRTSSPCSPTRRVALPRPASASASAARPATSGVVAPARPSPSGCGSRPLPADDPGRLLALPLGAAAVQGPDHGHGLGRAVGVVRRGGAAPEPAVGQRLRPAGPLGRGPVVAGGAAGAPEHRVAAR